MSAIAWIQVLLAGGVSAAYFTIAGVLVPKIHVENMSSRFEQIFRLGALAFFIGCGLTHLHIAVHAITDPDAVKLHELGFHLLQVIGGWAFIISAIALLEIQVSRRPSPAEIAAADLLEENTELTRSNEDLERFAHIVSHDLREPLRSISGFAQLLERRYGGQLDERADGYVEHIVGSTERMSALLDGVLAYSRTSGAELHPGPVDLGTVIERVETALASRIAGSGAEIEIDGDLPTVRGDQVQIEQLFLNLIANAVKYVDEGVAPRITVSAAEEGGSWRISVADNGIGIEPRARERVFEMFNRLHGRNDYDGIGIGLTICERIAARHGGTIAISDAPGGGSVFTVSLPVAGVAAGVHADDLAVVAVGEG